MSQEPEDVKPKLNINLDYEGAKITVKVRANMKFQKIFDAAHTKFNKQPGTLKFYYDGKRIQNEDTPASVEMEDGDQIDCFLEQLGGGIPSTSPSYFAPDLIFSSTQS